LAETTSIHTRWSIGQLGHDRAETRRQQNRVLAGG
jgi:hypothetical protein